MPADTLLRGRSLFSLILIVAIALVATPAPSRASSTKPKASARTTRARATRPKTPAKHAKARAGYHPHLGLAPADEYFGRLGMSILGVRSKVKDLGLEADEHPDRDRAVLGAAIWVEDAMRDWAKKYPFDRWLPRYAYALEVMYERIPGSEAHRRAIKQVSYITAYFPQTIYGRIGRAKLAAGIPMPDPSDPPVEMTDLDRLALLDGKTPPTMPPAPTPHPTASPAPSPEPTASAQPTPAPEPSASPRPSP